MVSNRLDLDDPLRSYISKISPKPALALARAESWGIFALVTPSPPSSVQVCEADIPDEGKLRV